MFVNQAHTRMHTLTHVHIKLDLYTYITARMRSLDLC